MKREHWKRAKDLISEAESLSSSGRQTFLDRECGDDAELRTLVDALLDATGPDPLGDLPPLPFKLIDETPPPEQIESYRLLHKLGQGGGGAVYLAEHTDDSFEQKVAIKILSTARDPNIAELFRKERQILADLHHHGICRLFSAGSLEDGRPYFIMEHIKGLTFVNYCEQHRLSESERLKLFMKACSAVEFAHRGMVVHLDLKPSNILVGEDGEPKLLDFGIAKILKSRHEGAVDFGEDTRILGTPQYASPELVDGKATTTASDVYSLGVILFQLLAGELPVGSLQPRAQAEKLQEKATHKFGGDLAAIVRKALQPDPEQRYRSVDRLAEDVQRLLDGRPILARQQSLPYIVGKHLRRHPIAASFGAIFVLSIFAFGFVLAQQQQQTARQRDKADEISTFLQSIFQNADPYKTSGEVVTARHLLESGARRIEAELPDTSEAKSDLLETMGVAYVNLGSYEEAEGLFEKALALQQQRLGEEHVAVASILQDYGHIHYRMGEFDLAVEKYLKALKIYKRELGEEDLTVANSLNALGVTYRKLGRYSEAERLYLQALEIRKSLLDPEDARIASSLNNLAVLYKTQERFEEAEPLYLRALEIKKSILGKNDPRLSVSIRNLAVFYKKQGRLSEAEQLYLQVIERDERILGPDHPAVAVGLNNLGVLYSSQERYTDAEPLHLRALEIRNQKLDEDHPLRAETFHNLASLYHRQGRRTSADEYFRKALAIREAKLGSDHRLVASSLHGLATSLREQGKTGEAERLFQRALGIVESKLGSHHSDAAPINYSLGLLYLQIGNTQAAQGYLTKSIEIRATALGKEHPSTQKYIKEYETHFDSPPPID